jgi:hypothetical protein
VNLSSAIFDGRGAASSTELCELTDESIIPRVSTSVWPLENVLMQIFHLVLADCLINDFLILVTD